MLDWNYKCIWNDRAVPKTASSTTKLQIQAHVTHCSTYSVDVGSWITCLSTLSHFLSLYLPCVCCNIIRKTKHVTNIVAHHNRYNRNAILKQRDRQLVSCFPTTAPVLSKNIDYLPQLGDETDFANFMAVIRACEILQFQQTGRHLADGIFQHIFLEGYTRGKDKETMRPLVDLSFYWKHAV